MQHTNTWSPMPARQTKNRSAMTVSTILNTRDCKALGSHCREESWRKDGKLGAVLGYFTSQSLTGKAAWLQHGWSTECKDSFQSLQQRVMLRFLQVRPPLGGCFNALWQWGYQGSLAAQLGPEIGERHFSLVKAEAASLKGRLKASIM